MASGSPESKEEIHLFSRKESPLHPHHMAEFKVDGVKYNFIEQYVLYKKAELCKATKNTAELMKITDPNQLRQFEKKFIIADHDSWETKLKEFTQKGYLEKSRQVKDLFNLLRDTKGKSLAYATRKDSVLGIGVDANDPLSRRKSNWMGKNLLGEWLMEVREQLSDQMEASSLDGIASKQYATDGSPQHKESVKDKEKFTFFWQKESPFSQWHPSSFVIDDQCYNCAEQYMMHQKAVTFGDHLSAQKMLRSKDPMEQKRLGRMVANFNDKQWDPVSMEVVRKGNLAKFGQNEKLKGILFETVGTTLVEASPYDKKWGIGLEGHDPRAKNRKQWLGKNQLGQVLTEVREELMRSEREDFHSTDGGKSLGARGKDDAGKPAKRKADGVGQGQERKSTEGETDAKVPKGRDRNALNKETDQRKSDSLDDNKRNETQRQNSSQRRDKTVKEENYQSPIQSYVIKSATVNDEIFVLCKPDNQDPFINVRDLNNVFALKDVIPLTGMLPLDIVACCRSNCIYLLNRETQCFSVMRIAKNEGDGQFIVSPWIADLGYSFSTARLFVSVNGHLGVLFRESTPQPSVVFTYDANGSFLRGITLFPEIHGFKDIASVVLKENGNIVLINDSAATELTEVNTVGRVVSRQHHGTLLGHCPSNVIDTQPDLLSTDTIIKPIEQVLAERVLAEVMDMKLAKSVWKEKADLVIDRLMSECLQWSSILTTKAFQAQLQKAVESTDWPVYSLEVEDQFPAQSGWISLTVMEDKFFIIQKTRVSMYEIFVYDKKNLSFVEQRIALPGYRTEAIAACSINKCLYVLVKLLNEWAVFKITKAGNGKYQVIAFGNVIKEALNFMCITSTGKVIVYYCDAVGGHAPSIVHILLSGGSVQKVHVLYPSRYRVLSVNKILSKADENLVMCCKGMDNRLTLIEIDGEGTEVRRHISEMDVYSDVAKFGQADYLLISGPKKKCELLDRELNVLPGSFPAYSGHSSLCPRTFVFAGSTRIIREDVTVGHNLLPMLTTFCLKE